MSSKKIDSIKKNIYFEEKIYDIMLKYPEVENLERADKLMFFSKKIEESELLTIEDWEYFNLACVIPFEEIQKELERYDNSSPKLDELKFIDDLSKKYNVNRNIILMRIKQVRKISKEIKKNSKPKLTVLAVPCNKTFVVAPNKVEEFLNSTNSKEKSEFVRKTAETFNINNLIDDKPKVKKLGEKTDKK